MKLGYVEARGGKDTKGILAIEGTGKWRGDEEIERKGEGSVQSDLSQSIGVAPAISPALAHGGG